MELDMGNIEKILLGFLNKKKKLFFFLRGFTVFLKKLERRINKATD